MASQLAEESPQPLRVLLIDDHRLLAQAIAVALRLRDVDVEVADLVHPKQLIAEVHANPPDLVLLDLNLGEGLRAAPGGRDGGGQHPGLVDGATLVRPLTEAGARVLVVTGSTDRCWQATALEAGAAGVASKSEPLEDLVATVVKAARGDEVMPTQERTQLLAELRAARARRERTQVPFRRLTARERQVLHALARGKSVTTISREWVVSEATVRSQVRGVLTKLGVSSQLEAVALALQAGWLSSAD